MIGLQRVMSAYTRHLYAKVQAGHFSMSSYNFSIWRVLVHLLEPDLAARCSCTPRSIVVSLEEIKEVSQRPSTDSLCRGESRCWVLTYSYVAWEKVVLKSGIIVLTSYSMMLTT